MMPEDFPYLQRGLRGLAHAAGVGVLVAVAMALLMSVSPTIGMQLILRVVFGFAAMWITLSIAQAGAGYVGWPLTLGAGLVALSAVFVGTLAGLAIARGSAVEAVTAGSESEDRQLGAVMTALALLVPVLGGVVLCAAVKGGGSAILGWMVDMLNIRVR